MTGRQDHRDGAAITATIAENGPESGSNLPVVRQAPDALTVEFAPHIPDRLTPLAARPRHAEGQPAGLSVFGVTEGAHVMRGRRRHGAAGKLTRR